MTRAPAPMLTCRALRINQSPDCPLYVFSLTAREVLQIAEISRVSRDHAGDLIGYQRPEVRQHIRDIVEYLDSDPVIFPNPIIVALSPTVRFTCGRGPAVGDGSTAQGKLEIPLPTPDGPKPGWIVDGQQRALALAQAKRQEFPVPISAFITDSIDLQRDQFVRINNTRPLPRGLVTELLPAISTPLPRRLALRQLPSALCDLLNTRPESPFCGMISRSSSPAGATSAAVVTDTSVVEMLKESLTVSSGCLFPFREVSTGDIDGTGIWQTVITYWSAIRETFPDAWGRPATESRLMHGAGIRAMGRLMDRVMGSLDASAADAAGRVLADLALVAPHCRWTSGTWEELRLDWNEVQNVGRHINQLSSYLIRLYLATKAAQR